ncbi:hypothetical protein BJ546DRAFT_961044 [Cryomyces antarcticus]
MFWVRALVLSDECSLALATDFFLTADTSSHDICNDMHDCYNCQRPKEMGCIKYQSSCNTLHSLIWPRNGYT